eukprot:7277174-Prymnesium_polylepis.1
MPIDCTLSPSGCGLRVSIELKSPFLFWADRAQWRWHKRWPIPTITGSPHTSRSKAAARLRRASSGCRSWCPPARWKKARNRARCCRGRCSSAPPPSSSRSRWRAPPRCALRASSSSRRPSRATAGRSTWSSPCAHRAIRRSDSYRSRASARRLSTSTAASGSARSGRARRPTTCALPTRRHCTSPHRLHPASRAAPQCSCVWCRASRHHSRAREMTTTRMRK